MGTWLGGETRRHTRLTESIGVGCAHKSCHQVGVSSFWTRADVDVDVAVDIDVEIDVDVDFVGWSVRGRAQPARNNRVKTCIRRDTPRRPLSFCNSLEAQSMCMPWAGFCKCRLALQGSHGLDERVFFHVRRHG